MGEKREGPVLGLPVLVFCFTLKLSGIKTETNLGYKMQLLKISPEYSNPDNRG